MQDNKTIDQLLIDSDVDWRAWPIVGPPRFSKQFKSGLNHHTLLFESAGKNYVLKLFESPSPIAINAQRWAAKRSLSPQVVYAPNDGRYLLMDFIKGDDLTVSAPDTDTINAVATALKTLHGEGIDQTGIACGYFNYIAYCEQYLQKCDREIQDLHQSLCPALDIFAHDQTPLTFCHNDLVLNNCMLFDNEAVLLDWEFAQINNPWFDLASIIYYWQLDEFQTQSLLSTYYAEAEQLPSTAIVHATQCAVVWLDILWSLDKFGPEHYSLLTEKLGHLKKLARALDIQLNL